MPRHRAGLFTALAVAAATLAAVPSAAQADDDCTGTALESATRNGSAALGGFEVSVTCTDTGSKDLSWRVTPTAGGYDLGAAARDDTWVLRFDTGSVVPRVAFTHGDAVSVSRSRGEDGHWHVRITAKPVLLLGECNQSAWPWTCPSVATQQWDGLLDGQITDYGTWEDTAQRDAFFGMDFSTDIAATSVPPEVVADSASGADMILLRFANPHFRKSPSTTVFRGSAHVRIPNAFLKAVYGIDSPATLTSAGLDPTVSGSGAGTVTVTDTGSALAVDVENLTFSARTVKVHRGTIVPKRPTGLTAKRTSSHKAKLGFGAAKARGSKVTGYTARCVARTGTHVVTDNESSGSPQYLTGLRSGVAYDCKVRAKSKAGPSAWTATVKVPKST